MRHISMGRIRQFPSGLNLHTTLPEALRLSQRMPELRKRSESSINRKRTSRSTDAMLFQAFSMMYEPTSASKTPNPSNQSDLTSSSVGQEQGWGLKKRRKNNIPKQVLRILKDLYNKGKLDKAHKISPDVASDIILSTIAKEDWIVRFILTPARIASFFSMAPTKMNEVCDPRLEKVEFTERDESDIVHQAEM